MNDNITMLWLLIYHNWGKKLYYTPNSLLEKYYQSFLTDQMNDVKCSEQKKYPN